MFARTERLLLRPVWTDDAPALFHAIADEAIVRNLASAPWPYRLADAQAFAARVRDPHDPCFAILRRTMGAPQLIGTIGIGPDPDGGQELGYFIARPHWGLGYATEAARAVIDIARHGLRLPRLKAGHFIDNPASNRVLRKLGFRPSGPAVPRYSAGRGMAALSQGYELALAGPAMAPADEEQALEMIAA